MSATNATRTRLGRLTITAIAAALLTGGYAHAQYIPPDMKAFAAQQLRSQYAARTAPHTAPARTTWRASAPAVIAPPATVTLSMTLPPTPAAECLAVRGQDGKVRHFPGEAGPAPKLVVRPGESISVQVHPMPCK
jgi:hypothetical protein